MRPLNVSSLYEYLIIAIVLQNATVRRSAQMMQALQERYGLLLAYFDAEFVPYQRLAVHYLWENLFWRRKYEPVPWLEELIRL